MFIGIANKSIKAKFIEGSQRRSLCLRVRTLARAHLLFLCVSGLTCTWFMAAAYSQCPFSFIHSVHVVFFFISGFSSSSFVVGFTVTRLFSVYLTLAHITLYHGIDAIISNVYLNFAQ